MLGGTFDPPHIGHLWLAQTAQEQLGLGRVLFLPAGQPPHKEKEAVTAVTHRLAMVQLAIQENPHFVLDTTDVQRPPPHRTVTLLPQIQAAYPGAQLWLLLGADSLRDMPEWAEPVRLLAQCRLAVLPRPGVKIDWAPLETAVPGIRSATDWLEGPALALSSTEIRAWAGQGRSLHYLLPATVAAYIKQAGLYRVKYN